MASAILGGRQDAGNPGVCLDGGASAKDDADVPWVMNVVNFMRGCEPRAPKRDLTKVLAEEIWFNNFYGLPNTILLQSASDGRQSA